MKKTIFAVLIVLTLSAIGFAQRGGPGVGGPGGPGGQRGPGGAPRDPAAGLKAALDLTDAQVESIRALNQSRQTTIQAIMTEINERRQTLQASLNVANPNALDVGNAAIALKTSEDKLKAEREAYIANLKQLLTTLQQETLDKLIAAGTPLPGLGGPGGRGGPGGPGGPGGRGGPRPQ